MVVLIIGILSAIALPQYTTAVEKARAAEAVTLMSAIRYAGERYRLENNEFPGGVMDGLDIEIPGLAEDGTSAQTKNFVIRTEELATNKYHIYATRKGGTPYVLGMIVSANGTATRCCGSALEANNCAEATGNALKICNAITGGHNTDGNW